MSTNFAFAQVDSVYIVNKDEVKHDPNFRANEIKINGLSTLLGMPEITYERVLSDETAAGISLALGADNTLEYNFMLTPYYRFYFGKKENAAGFFLEANGSVFSYDDYYYSFNNNDSKTEIGYGLGLAIGSKFMTRSQKWFGEIVYGLGRNFAQSQGYGMSIYPRVGINIGRRF